MNIKTFKMMLMMTLKAETHSLVWNVIVTGSSRGKVYNWPLPGNNHKIIFKLPKPKFNLLPGERMIRLPQNSVCPSTGGKIVM